MLTAQEIKQFIDEDNASLLKRKAREGQRYYDGEHDILDYRLFYYNADGNLVEDKTRSNVKIPHPFFTELVDQATQYVLSGDDRIFRSDDTELQKHLDTYFNENENFMSELSETITGQQVKGFDYMYCYKGADDKLKFENADSLGVVEVEARFAEDKKEHRIYKYLDRIDKEGKMMWKILDIDDENTQYWKQTDDGEIVLDDEIEINPKPHAIYEMKKKGGSESQFFTKDFGFLPFFRLDNNKKKISSLKPIKPHIDDYDIMASSLTNNLIDFDHPLHVVKGFQGDNLDELQKNLKTKRIIGVGENGDVDVRTVDVPYQARIAKLELDEKCIYRFGMGLNTAGLKDTSATTNIAIKSAYALLDMKCNKIITQLKMFLRKILKVVIDEINEQNGTGYDCSMVYFKFKPEVMSNAQENAQIELIEAQTRQVEINIILSLQAVLDDETFMQLICEQLDIDYEDIKDKLPKQEEIETVNAQSVLDGVVTGEQGTEGNTTITTE